jgi:F0F1-type ATP synthase membrane subunit b/b'
MKEILAIFTLTPIDGYMILVSSVLFFFFWRMLDVKVFQPFIDLSQKREELTVGSTERAKLYEAQTDQLHQKLDRELTQARVDAMKMKLERLAKARQEASGIIAKAQSEAHQHIHRSREEIKAKIDQASAVLDKTTDELSAEITRRIFSAQ